MILYVNGCSHTAAAEAVVSHCFAEDDGNLPNNHLLGRRPHPANLAASWCTHLANQLCWPLVCDAESASSNDRILRTTHEWLRSNPDQEVFMIIQWSTWEREEWFHDGVWYQVNASGVDTVPPELQDRYRRYICDIDWTAKTHAAHTQIWDFHQYLTELEIPHVFYSSWSTFSDIPAADQKNWGASYMSPYDRSGSYAGVLQKNGYHASKFYHFGADGHRFWAQHVLQYIDNNHLR